jgi:hypothetical protein
MGSMKKLIEGIESAMLSEAKEKKQWSMGDSVDQGAISKAGKGIKIDGKIWKWAIDKFAQTGAASYSSEDNSIGRQQITIDKKSKQGTSHINITPIGNYVMVKEENGSGKTSVRYFEF